MNTACFQTLPITNKKKPASVCLHVCLYAYGMCVPSSIFLGAMPANRCSCSGFSVCCGAVLAGATRVQEGEEASVQYIVGIMSATGPSHFWTILLWCLSARLYQTQTVLFPPLPSVQLGKAGWLTSGWPIARPMTLYQTDHAMFISLRDGDRDFSHSQVEAIDSLCTVVINSLLEDWFWVIKTPLASGMLIKVGWSFNVLQRGTSSHYTFLPIGMRWPRVNL